MTDAVIGLVGAVIGAGISTGANVLLEERRHRRNFAAEQRRSENSLRQAGRLITEELTDSELTLLRALELREWWPAPAHQLPNNRWDHFGPVLAQAEANDQWHWVSHAFQLIRDTNAELATYQNRNGELPTFDAERDRSLRVLLREVQDGIKAAAHFSGELTSHHEPDVVSACHHAAVEAAHELTPGSYRVDWLKPGNYYEAKAEVLCIGVALARAPDWEHFECVLPVGTRIRVAELTEATRDVSSTIAGVVGGPDAVGPLMPTSLPNRLNEEADVLAVLLGPGVPMSPLWMHLGLRLPGPHPPAD